MTILHQIQGDVFHVGPRLPSCWCHGALLDPIYGWSFMGRGWDAAHRKHAIGLLDEQAWRIGWATSEERKARGLKPWNDAELYALWSLGWLRQLYRVLVPGSYAVVFHGSKSYQRLAFPAELAGFQVQPMLTGVVGSAMGHGGDLSKLIDREAGAERTEIIGTKLGMPGKAKDFSNQGFHRSNLYGDGKQLSSDITAPATPLGHSFDGHRTRLRDQLMPICVLLKPPEGSYAANARKWGVGGFAIDACRVETTPEDAEAVAASWSTSTQGYSGKVGYGYGTVSRPDISAGRFPGNALLIDEEAEAEVGRQSGESEDRPGTRWRGNDYREASEGRRSYGNGGPGATTGYSTSGTAARFFPRFRYTARAAEQERLRGCEGFLWIADKTDAHGWRRVESTEWLAAEPRRRLQGTMHTTLKPLELCRWLARLILPPAAAPAVDIRRSTTGSSGRLLVPFAGVLSEAIGAALAGWPEVVAIEAEETFNVQGAARWRGWQPFSPARADRIEDAGGFRQIEQKDKKKPPKWTGDDWQQTSLFEAAP